MGRRKRKKRKRRRRRRRREGEEERRRRRNSVKNLADGVRKVDERRSPGHSPRLLPLPLSPKKMKCI